MTTVIAVNHLHKVQGAPITLARGRRRLSAIVRRHGPADRRVVALVFRRGENWRAADRGMLDRAARLRSQYADTLLGPHDTVILVRPPLGGGQSGAGIAMAIAAIALMVVAPYAAPAIAGFAGLGAAGAFAIQGGMVVGAAIMGAAAMRANSAKQKTDGEDFLSLSASGNVARRGDRLPLIYGRCWTAPPLSQRDYIQYVGNRTTILTKRLTLGLGKFDVEEIRVGEATFWKKVGGVQPPFSAIPQYAPPAAVEILYEQASTILPGDVATSESVVGQELPRPGENPEWTPWYRAAPQGVATKKVYLAWNFPSVMRRKSDGAAAPMNCGISFQYQRLDPATGNPIPGTLATDVNTAYAFLDEGGHFGKELEFPVLGEWQVRAANSWLDPDTYELEASNAVHWDEMSALLPDPRVREKTTEIVIRISGLKGLSSLNDVQVLATRILPVWNGTAWVEQPTRKCVWAAADLVRNEYGLERPDSFDVVKAALYAARPDLDGIDTYDGQLPSVSSFPDAINEVLGPLRAEYVKIGSIYSFARDESAAEAGGRRVITRRQTIRDSSSQRMIFAKSDSAQGDFIVEFLRDGDPRRPDEVRQTIFPATRTPKRVRWPGVSQGAHALMIANWLAVLDRYRAAERKITLEWEGRLIYPATHILSDLWFLDGKATVSVAVVTSGGVLTLDEWPPLPAGATYASIRDRRGREWGILRATYDGAGTLTLNATDLAARIASSGQQLLEVLALDHQDPTTIVLGDLVELQETYLARACRPVDEDHVEIEMVIDDERVWTALGETPIVPGPVTPEGPLEILRPQIQSLRAQCLRTETDIRLVWSIGQPRGGVTYDVEYAIDDDEDGPADTWQTIQADLASLSGSVPIRQSTLPVRVRARAYGRTGLASDWVQTTFTTLRPAIDGKTTDIVDVALSQLSGQLQDVLTGTGPGSVGEAKALADQAQARANAAFGSIEDVKLALSPSSEDRARSSQSVRALREDLASALAVIENLQLRMEKVGGILTQIGVTQTEGAYVIAGEAQLGARINQVSITLDALAAKVQLLATTVIDGNLDGLLDTVNQLSITLDAIETELDLKVSTTDLEAEVEAQVTDLEIKMSGEGGVIKILTDRLEAAEGLVTSAMLQVSALGQIVAGTSATALKQDGDQTAATIESILARIAQMEGTFGSQIATTQWVMGSRIGELGQSIAESSKTLLAVQGDTAARFTASEKAIADGISAEVTARRQLEATVGSATGRIGEIENAVTNTNNTSSQVSRLKTLEGKVDGDGTEEHPGLSGRMTTVEEAVLDEDDGLVRKVEDLVLGTGDDSLQTRLSDVQQVVGKAASPGVPASGLVSKVTVLEATVNGDGTEANPSLSAKITTAQNAAVAAQGTADSAATTATSAQTTANGVTATARFGMTSRAGPSGGDALIAMQVSRLSGGAKADGGFYVLATAGGQIQSFFDVDKFYVGKFGAGGSLASMVKLIEVDAATSRVTIPNLLVTGNLLAPNTIFDRGERVLASDISINTISTNTPIPALRSDLTIERPCTIEIVNSIKYTLGASVGTDSNYLYLRIKANGVVLDTLEKSTPSHAVDSLSFHTIDVTTGPFPKTITIEYDYTCTYQSGTVFADPKVKASRYYYKYYYRGG